MKKLSLKVFPKSYLLPVAAMAITLTAATPAGAAVLLNGGFEDNAASFTNYPGQALQNGNPEIANWATTGSVGGGYGPGVNGRPAPIQTPFLSLGAITEGTSAAFIQGGVNGLSQTLTGLTVGAQYWISYREDARTADNTPVATITVDGTTIVAAHTVTNVGNSNPYAVKISSAFTATASTATLIISNTFAGDHTALFDDVRIYSVNPGAAPTGVNSSFESSPVTAGQSQLGSQPGGLGASRWGFRGSAGIGNNGNGYGSATAPDGTNVAIIQNLGTFSDVYGTFESNVTYTLSFDVAARGGGGNPFSVLLDETLIMFGTNSSYTPLSTSFTNITSATFTTTAGPKELTFVGLNASGDLTSFFDNIQFTVIPEPSTYAMVACGLGILACLRRRNRAD